MSETRKIFVDSVEDKNGFFIVHSGSDKYATKETGIKAFEGREAVFNVASQRKGNYTNWYINKPLPEVPKVDPVKSSSMPKENTMLMSYAKDLVVALINSSSIKEPDKAAAKTVEFYNELLSGMNREGEEIPF